MKPATLTGEEPAPSHGVWPRFRAAFAGLYAVYLQERHLRFHVFAASCAVLVGVAVRLEVWEAAYLALTVAAVLVAEVLNTAVERVVDLTTGGRYHPLAGSAKDMAAGAVFLAALHSVFAAFLLFSVRHGIGPTWRAVLALLHHAPWVVLIPLATGLAGLLVGRTEAGSRS